MNVSFKCRYGDHVGTITLDKNRRFHFTDALFSVRGWYIKQSDGIFLQEDSGAYSRVNWAGTTAAGVNCVIYDLTRDKLDSILASVRSVCVVSNKHDYDVSYSTFVDSCDVVIRVNKMESQGTCLTGSKTDIAVIAVNDIYYSYTDEERKVDVLKKTPLVVLGRSNDALTAKFKEELATEAVCDYPAFMWKKAFHMTTFAQAVVLALSVFPDAKVYFLCDLDCYKRSLFDRDVNFLRHVVEYDDAVLSGLVARGRLLIPDGGYKTDATHLACTALDRVYGRNDKVKAIRVNDPATDWRIILNDNRASRSYKAPYSGVILARDIGAVTLHWEGEDIDRTYLDAGGFYLEL